MANRAGNDDRSFGASDRERRRDVTSEPNRSQSPVSGANLGVSSGNVGGIAGSSGGAGANRVATNQGGNGTGSGSTRKSARGFASMDAVKQKEIASKGGRAAHAKGTAPEFDTNEARAAGR
jgi:hypothetical protein